MTARTTVTITADQTGPTFVGAAGPGASVAAGNLDSIKFSGQNAAA